MTTRRVIELASLILALLGAFAAVARSYYVTPVRLDELAAADTELRRTIDNIRESRAVDHDLLQRIDERTAQTQRDIDELKRRPSR